MRRFHSLVANDQLRAHVENGRCAGYAEQATPSPLLRSIRAWQEANARRKSPELSEPPPKRTDVKLTVIEGAKTHGQFRLLTWAEARA